ELGIELVEDMSTEETIKWLQSNKALALFNQETNQALRELALTNQVIVMSAEETVRAFSMMSDNELNVTAIQHYHINNKKEVILMIHEEMVLIYSKMSDNELNVKAIQHYQINNKKEVILK